MCKNKARNQAHYPKFIDLDVLAADDDIMSLEPCCRMLNDLGMKAKGVSSGAEAVVHAAGGT